MPREACRTGQAWSVRASDDTFRFESTDASPTVTVDGPDTYTVELTVDTWAGPATTTFELAVGDDGGLVDTDPDTADDVEDTGGCSCAATPALVPLAWGALPLLGLLAVRRRR